MLTRKTKKPQFDRVSDSTGDRFSRVQTSDSDVRFFHFAGCFGVNKMFINTIWKLFNVNNTRRICATFVRVESIKTARTECEF